MATHSIPNSGPSGQHALYRFYGDTGQLLYVGISIDPSKRFPQHAATKAWWTSVRGISVEWYSSRKEALAAESRAIQVERPLANISRPALRPVDPECGHCIGCIREGECYVYKEYGEDEDFHTGACRVCGKDYCLFELGYEYGDQHGWSRAFDWHEQRRAGGL